MKTNLPNRWFRTIWTIKWKFFLLANHKDTNRLKRIFAAILLKEHLTSFINQKMKQSNELALTLDVLIFFVCYFNICNLLQLVISQFYNNTAVKMEKKSLLGFTALTVLHN